LFCRFVPGHHLYRVPTIREVRIDNLALSLDISDYVSHYAYYGFSDLSLSVLLSLVREGDNVIDVGANIGVVGLRLARKIFPGKVLSIEPDKTNFEAASQNVQRNQITNLSLMNVAVGHARGTAVMHERAPGNRAGNRMAPDGITGYEVTMTLLDALVEVDQLRPVRLMKIDVEGYELRVLKGSRRLLQEDRPSLFVEIDDNNLRDQGDSAADLVHVIWSMGYTKLTRADTGQPVTPHSDFRNCHFDLVAHWSAQ
jgi:FkbM family methyltransferase